MSSRAASASATSTAAQPVVAAAAAPAAAAAAAAPAPVVAAAAPAVAAVAKKDDGSGKSSSLMAKMKASPGMTAGIVAVVLIVLAGLGYLIYYLVKDKSLGSASTTGKLKFTVGSSTYVLSVFAGTGSSSPTAFFVKDGSTAAALTGNNAPVSQTIKCGLDGTLSVVGGKYDGNKIYIPAASTTVLASGTAAVAGNVASQAPVVGSTQPTGSTSMVLAKFGSTSALITSAGAGLQFLSGKELPDAIYPVAASQPLSSTSAPVVSVPTSITFA